MKRILQSRLITDYGMVLVLLLLGVLISWATWDEQHPETPGAGRSLAGGMVEVLGEDLQVVIVLRQTSGDRRYAEAIAGELERRGVTVAIAFTRVPCLPSFSSSACASLAELA